MCFGMCSGVYFHDGLEWKISSGAQSLANWHHPPVSIRGQEQIVVLENHWSRIPRRYPKSNRQTL